MKKIFTLAVAALMTTLAMAADRPSVILNSSRNFEVVIDGRSFVTNGRTVTLDHLRTGRHSIRVYELKRGFRGNIQKRLVSRSHFNLRNRDVLIRINQFGEVMTKESRTRVRGRNERQRDWDFDDDFGWRRN
jgi:hypothetical protein